MTKYVRALFLAGILVFASLGSAQSEQSSSITASESLSQRTEFANRLVGAEQFLQAFAGWRPVFEQIDLSQCMCSGDETETARYKAAWKIAVDSTYDVDGAVGRLIAAYASAFSLKALKEMTALAESPIAKRIHSIQIRQPTEEQTAAQEMARFQAALDELNADSARKVVIDEIASRSGGVDALADVLISVSIGTSLGIAAGRSDGLPRPSDDEIVQMVELNRPEVRKLCESILLGATAMIYRPLSLEELIKYRNFLGHTLVQESSVFSLEFFKLELRAQAIAIGKVFARELQKVDM